MFSHSDFSFGRLILNDGTEELMTLRDIPNKIIHAAALEWDTKSGGDFPQLVCRGRSSDLRGWKTAYIEIVTLLAIFGKFGAP